MRRFLAFGLFLLCGLCQAATVYITEYQENVRVTYQAVITPALASQTVASVNRRTETAFVIVTVLDGQFVSSVGDIVVTSVSIVE